MTGGGDDLLLSAGRDAGEPTRCQDFPGRHPRSDLRRVSQFAPCRLAAGGRLVPTRGRRPFFPQVATLRRRGLSRRAIGSRGAFPRKDPLFGLSTPFLGLFTTPRLRTAKDDPAGWSPGLQA